MHDSNSRTPEELNALFQESCNYHQEGNLGKAKEGYTLLLEHVDAPLLHYNLGLVHFELGEMKNALTAFESAHAGDPGDLDTLFNMALCQKRCGLHDEACSTYRKLINQEPTHLDAIYNLANCYRTTRQDNLAIEQYRLLLEHQPEHLSALNNLAYMYQLTGDTENAVNCYRRLVELDPGREAAKHMLAALSGDNSNTPPEAYVKELFDNYSDHYEQSLIENLDYHVPSTLREMLENLADCPQQFHEGIDLGCGTGLSGEAFIDIVMSFDGIDLSAKMIEIAKNKNFYRHLYTDTITTALSRNNHAYDFVLAADVFGYIGDLTPIIHAVNCNTKAGTIFCGSIEAGEISPFQLRISGRIAHSPEYFLKLVQQHGWTPLQFRQTQLRRERNDWINGYIWILQKCSE